MGLDVSAYSRVERMDPQPEEHEGDGALLWVNPDFPGRANGLDDGWYGFETYGGGPSLSYGGYNLFRKRLCRIVLDVDPSFLWEYPHIFEGKPFYEIINFSDCEGVFGPETCAKLAQDFADHMDQVRDHLNEWQFRTYCQFHEAFKTGADGGAVQFH